MPRTWPEASASGSSGKGSHPKKSFFYGILPKGGGGLSRPGFLREIEKTKTNKLPENTILATLDVKALFTNIKHEEGLESMKKRLEEQTNPAVKPDFILRLMEILLKHNIFSFHGESYIQNIGAPMGSSPVPEYADMFMDDRIDKKIENEARKYNKLGQDALRLLKRFLDDILLIFCGTSKKLQKLLSTVHITSQLRTLLWFLRRATCTTRV